MRNFTLDGRLSSAAKFVRQGARFADIGTDHAYLPIFLLRSGRIDYAFASDINDGPLASAIENAREAGVYSKMEFALADGLDAIRDTDITDIDSITHASKKGADGSFFLVTSEVKFISTGRRKA